MSKVYLGMSGGVDSSVSAALLKHAGHEVIGVFMRGWEPFDSAQGKPEFDSTGGKPENQTCTWRAERRDAMRVAAALDIPLLTLDLAAEYKRDVVDYLLAEYAAGRTPNPDVECNRQIKFGAFFNWAVAHGADFVATGHYARVKTRKFLITNSKFLNGNSLDIRNYKLEISRDRDKDQTYFLWTLTPKQLSRILFPIGHLTKPAVRRLAAKFKLPTATKKDSQGLCFVGQFDFKEFLRQELKPEAGLVLDESGTVIGQHDGAVLYTIGERHGFRLGQGGGEPRYVIARDLAANTLTVSTAPEKIWRQHKEIKLSGVNWISNQSPIPGDKLFARIRHRGELYPCRLAEGERVIFDRAPEAIAPGQSLVLYRGQECLGGGIIA
jgi:tRNA-specific 2-thiouridylase